MSNLTDSGQTFEEIMDNLLSMREKMEQERKRAKNLVKNALEDEGYAPEHILLTDFYGFEILYDKYIGRKALMDLHRFFDGYELVTIDSVQEHGNNYLLLCFEKTEEGAKEG